MKKINSLLFALLFMMCLPVVGQTPAYDDLTMESDEITETYRSTGKNFAFIRSKRGTSGLNHTSTGDSIKAFPINEIVLVFTEVNESAFDEREDANRERWENLMKTYPEYFQTSTTYKSLCQCKIGGDSVSFKKAQGFYIYYTGKAVKAPEPVAKVEEKKVEEKKVEEKKVETKKTEEKIAETKKVEEKKVEEKKDVVKEIEKPAKEVEKKKEEKVVVEETKPVEESTVTEEPVVKAVPQKKAPVGKARRAKDPKACRPACYESGDEDLNAFFKSNLTFTKKERRHVKKLSPVVKIQLNVDGSIKKVIVTGEDEVLNKKVEGAVNGMNKWNAAVKNGVTVKSEVKITLKYDKDSKGLKPFEVVMVPRPGPKCKCVSDSEMFGD